MPSVSVQQPWLGLGQLLHYRSLFRTLASEVCAVLAVEYEPTNAEWMTLCQHHGADLVWPGVFDRLGPTGRVGTMVT